MPDSGPRQTSRQTSRRDLPLEAPRGAENGAMPADVRLELRRLLAEMLVADYRANQADSEAVSASRVVSVWGCNPGPEARRDE